MLCKVTAHSLLVYLVSQYIQPVVPLFVWTSGCHIEWPVYKGSTVLTLTVSEYSVSSDRDIPECPYVIINSYTITSLNSKFCKCSHIVCLTAITNTCKMKETVRKKFNNTCSTNVFERACVFFVCLCMCACLFAMDKQMTRKKTSKWYKQLVTLKTAMAKFIKQQRSTHYIWWYYW